MIKLFIYLAFFTAIIEDWFKGLFHAYKKDNISEDATDDINKMFEEGNRYLHSITDTQPVKVRRYTAKQIKPKRYSRSIYLPINEHVYYWTFLESWQRDNFPFLQGTAWFIDVANAPKELKPLAYPENKPKEDGYYWLHKKGYDDWYKRYWADVFEIGMQWDMLCDYFIPYQLESVDK